MTTEALKAAENRPSAPSSRSFVCCFALLCAIAALTGCHDRTDDAAPRTSAQPSASTTVPVASKEIRRIDFANLLWYDAMTASTVQLVNGFAQVTNSDLGKLTWQVSGPPSYSDVDGDGHEDAAVSLKANRAQLVANAWYIWLWRGGRAQQLRLPIAQTSRCNRPIESVKAVPRGFKVQMFMSVEEDDCAGGGSVPITYVAGVQHGWPVRIEPRYGPIETCDPRALTVALHPSRKILLFTAADARSPVVEPARRYEKFLVTEYDNNPELFPEQEWILGIAVSGARRVCGWVSVDQIRASTP
ncbi:hypothetical protein [Streptomyces sp. NBC_01190]|uniref:hypothetical protein n=1 Tax=Streptomyces sp. NBC_01190 TaxID=2903767 RepID=UPI00386A7CD3|nr:hypothetical protein OG519_29140 [Streptomyces sp. NBC_01190]